MKKVSNLLFSFLILLFFVSCSDNRDKPATVVKKAPQSDASPIGKDESNPPKKNEEKKVESRRFLIAFKGNAIAYEDRLYVISSLAREGFPKEFSRYPTRFFEITSSDNKNILYSIVKEEEKKAIVRFNVKTNFLYRFLPDQGNIYGLQVNSDKTKVAYIKDERNRRQSLNIYTLKTKQSKKMVLNQNEKVSSFRFAPDSQSVILTKQVGRRAFYVNVVLGEDTFGKSSLVLQKDNVILSEPVFMTAQKALCFVEKNGNMSRLKILNVQQSKEILLYETEAIFGLSLSPNGKFLAFWSHSIQGQRLHLYEFSSGKIKTITNLRVPMKGQVFYRKDRVHPVWTPDSREIIYSSFDGWNGQIYKYNRMSGEIVKLTDNMSVDFYAPIVLGEEKL